MTSYSGDPATPSEPVTRRMPAQPARPVGPQHQDSIITDRYRAAGSARPVAPSVPASTWQHIPPTGGPRVTPTVARKPAHRPTPAPTAADHDIAFNLVVPPDLLKRHRTDLSVIVAGIVMMLLGLGVVVGLLML